VLADGMGGHNAGEVASGMAVAMISHELRPFFAARSGNALGETEVRQLLTGLAAKVNTAIYNTAQSQPRYFGMGTTLVIALWHGEQLTVAHLGDSRLYRLRGDRYEQLTRDHSWRQEQIDSGLVTPEQARTTGAKNIVTRACGIEPAVEPEVHTHPSQADDLYLLCSDGLSEMVADDAVRHLLLSHKSDLPRAASELVRQANDNGGKDNVSVILVRIPNPRHSSRLLGRFGAWLK